MKKWNILAAIAELLLKSLIVSTIALFVSVVLLVSSLYIPNMVSLRSYIPTTLSTLTIVLEALAYPWNLRCRKTFFKKLSWGEKNLLRFFRERPENCKYFSMYDSEEAYAEALRQKGLLIILNRTQEIDPNSGSRIGLTYCVRDSVKNFLIKHPHLLDDSNR